jgi:hypothetical protein
VCSARKMPQFKSSPAIAQFSNVRCECV